MRASRRTIFAETDYPTLGVCLGHQALCAAHGCDRRTCPGGDPRQTSDIVHDGTEVYEGIDDPFEVGRYHSLAVGGDLPAELIGTAWTAEETSRRMS